MLKVEPETVVVCLDGDGVGFVEIVSDTCEVCETDD